MINITHPQEITKIYLVENCYGDPNKIYIGKTKKTRLYKHRAQFGKQITYTIIDEVNSLNSKDWKPLECFWIEQFRSWGFKIQNKNGGGGGSEYLSSFTINKIKLKHQRIILQYDIKGNFIKKWDSIKQAGIINKIHPSGISNCANKRQRTYKNFIWSFKKIKKTDEIFIKTDRKNKPILQYDLEGNFLQEFKSIQQAKNLYKITGISVCLNGNAKKAKNWLWKFKTDNYPKKIKPYKT